MKTIKKKTLRVALLLMLLFTLFVPSMVFAYGGYPHYLDMDDAGLLTSGEAASLEAKLQSISEKHDFDVVIAVVESLDGSEAHEYAAEVYEDFEFGLDEDFSGAILLLATEDRDFGFATTGYGEYAFTSVGQEYLDTFYLPYLSEDEYAAAFSAFAGAVDQFLTQAEQGEPYDGGNIPKSAGSKAIPYVVSIIIGLVVALVVTLVMKAQLKSVRANAFATEYVRSGSLSLRVQSDQFLFKTVTKTRRVKEEVAKGVASSFSSSSGRSYSGHSGKY